MSNGLADFCRNMHDRSVTGRTPKGRCRECERARDRQANRRKSCSHPGECVPFVTSNGARNCRIRTQMIAQRGGVASRDSKAVPILPPAPDGWEDEFGPVPQRVPDVRWFDRVAVLRSLTGERETRELTVGEKRGVHLLRLMGGNLVRVGV